MSEMRFTKDHEWVRMEGGVATCGISTYAQEQLGDVVFVDLPEVGRTVEKGDDLAVVESVKAASDVYAPIAGEIVAVNEALADDPGLVNGSSETEGWFFKIRPASEGEVGELMSQADYDAYLKDLD